MIKIKSLLNMMEHYLFINMHLSLLRLRTSVINTMVIHPYRIPDFDSIKDMEKLTFWGKILINVKNIQKKTKKRK